MLEMSNEKPIFNEDGQIIGIYGDFTEDDVKELWNGKTPMYPNMFTDDTPKFQRISMDNDEAKNDEQR